MELYEKLLLENKAWAEEIEQYNPKYFENLSKSQAPSFLWIGCSDSRVPANEITNTSPGQMFVHRNIANMVIPDDLSVLSVIQYAVEVLKVLHVIICGHYNCGGVVAALGDKKFGIIDNWLAHIKKVHTANREEVNACKSEQEKMQLMVELNVKQQLINLMNTKSVQQAWKRSQYPVLHGWIYGLENGRIKEVFTLTRQSMQDTSVSVNL